MKDFTHLHSHSIFSTLDGVAKPEDYICECSNRGWKAIALTEHGYVSSLPDAFTSAQENGIKLIPGYEAYFNDFNEIRQKATDDKDYFKRVKKEEKLFERMNKNRHLTVICKNEEGYRNLLKINRLSWEQHNQFRGRPRISFDLLAKYHKGIIVLSGCFNGPISHEILDNRLEASTSLVKMPGAYDYVRDFKKVFKDDFYIELQMPGVPKDVELFEKLVEVSIDFKIKPVCTNDVHYLKKEDFEVQKLMMAIGQGTTVDDKGLFFADSSEQFLKTREELEATFNEKDYSKNVASSIFKSACDNTLEISDKCEGFKPDLSPKLPEIENSDAKLKLIIAKELKRRGFAKCKDRYNIDGIEVTYVDQSKIELGRIIEKGFSSYFLIMQDLVNYSRENCGPVGPSRGSVGGSLVSFLLGITTVDPLKWGLSFNRMMSPARGGKMLNVTIY